VRPQHAAPRRRRSRTVYLRRRIAALILLLLAVALLVVAVDKFVRAVQPGRHTSTRPTRVTTRVTRGGTGGGSSRAGAAPVVGAPPATAPVGNTTVVLSAVGDLQLGTTGQLPSDPAHYLDRVQSHLVAPIVFGNLDGTLGTGSSSKCPVGSAGCFAFQYPPSYAAYLYADGFDVLNSANNHTDDFGPPGITATSSALASAHIVQAGLPGQIGVISDGGTKVAFVDFAPYDTANNLLDLPAAKALIARARTLAPVVIVYMHAGAEGTAAAHVTGADESYKGEARGNAEVFAKAAIDDGAAAVIASGPHVLRGMQLYRGHLIDYSLGDFAGYKNFATTGTLDLSGILHLELSPTGTFLHGSWTSLVLDADGRPALDPSRASVTFVNGLSQADFGATAAVIGPDGAISAAQIPGNPATASSPTRG